MAVRFAGIGLPGSLVVISLVVAAHSSWRRVDDQKPVSRRTRRSTTIFTRPIRSSRGLEIRRAQRHGIGWSTQPCQAIELRALDQPNGAPLPPDMVAILSLYRALNFTVRFKQHIPRIERVPLAFHTPEGCCPTIDTPRISAILPSPFKTSSTSQVLWLSTCSGCRSHSRGRNDPERHRLTERQPSPASWAGVRDGQCHGPQRFRCLRVSSCLVEQLSPNVGIASSTCVIGPSPRAIPRRLHLGSIVHVSVLAINGSVNLPSTVVVGRARRRSLDVCRLRKC